MGIMKMNAIIARNPAELSQVLGLNRADAIEWELRCTPNDKIIDAVRKSGYTHANVAKLARTSRTRVTALLNRNTEHVSTDLMLRILAALGYRARI
jgi:hypothetical protein